MKRWLKCKKSCPTYPLNSMFSMFSNFLVFFVYPVLYTPRTVFRFLSFLLLVKLEENPSFFHKLKNAFDDKLKNAFDITKIITDKDDMMLSFSKKFAHYLTINDVTLSISRKKQLQLERKPSLHFQDY